jgi:hypothetical protein
MAKIKPFVMKEKKANILINDVKLQANVRRKGGKKANA